MIFDLKFKLCQKSSTEYMYVTENFLICISNTEIVIFDIDLKPFTVTYKCSSECYFKETSDKILLYASGSTYHIDKITNFIQLYDDHFIGWRAYYGNYIQKEIVHNNTKELVFNNDVVLTLNIDTIIRKIISSSCGVDVIILDFTAVLYNISSKEKVPPIVIKSHFVRCEFVDEYLVLGNKVLDPKTGEIVMMLSSSNDYLTLDENKSGHIVWAHALE